MTLIRRYMTRPVYHTFIVVLIVLPVLFMVSAFANYG